MVRALVSDQRAVMIELRGSIEEVECGGAVGVQDAELLRLSRSRLALDMLRAVQGASRPDGELGQVRFVSSFDTLVGEEEALAEATREAEPAALLVVEVVAQ